MSPWRALIALCLAVPALSLGCRPDVSTAAALIAPSGYTGREVCGSCHPGELRAFLGSHHDRAMEEGEEALGDFSDVTVPHPSESFRFATRNGQKVAVARGANGTTRELPVRYTFGVAPLQQVLVETERGRLQALPAAWDVRPEAEGGQRWFHLYPEEKLPAGDPLHWAGRLQNWNSMCAECHSTGVEKGYDPGTDTFTTTFAEIDVSCEACHGPGAQHVVRARAGRLSEGSGLAVQTITPAQWTIDPATGSARPQARSTEAELASCGQCHSRRTPLTEGYEAGRPLLDTHRLALLEPGLYHADGQVEGEVFELGSFLQSRMHTAGVACTDCHEPHAATLRAEGNALCTRCHEPASFDTPQHHHHASGSAAAACVSCHMPETTFMGIDGRRDHSLRVPRPDVSVAIGTPNACTSCHAKEGAAWAAAAVVRWGGKQRGPHWGEALAAGFAGTPDAGAGLERVALDAAVPGIARATAVELLARFPSPAAEEAARQAARDVDALVRAAAATLSSALPGELRRELATPLLADPVRAVRLAAAKALLPDTEELASFDRAAYDAALEELITAERAHAERPEALLNLGAYEAARGELEAARRAFERALTLDPSFEPARINLGLLASAASGTQP